MSGPAAAVLVPSLDLHPNLVLLLCPLIFDSFSLKS